MPMQTPFGDYIRSVPDLCYKCGRGERRLQNGFDRPEFAPEQDPIRIRSVTPSLHGKLEIPLSSAGLAEQVEQFSEINRHNQCWPPGKQALATTVSRGLLCD